MNITRTARFKIAFKKHHGLQPCNTKTSCLYKKEKWHLIVTGAEGRLKIESRAEPQDDFYLNLFRHNPATART